MRNMPQRTIDLHLTIDPAGQLILAIDGASAVPGGARLEIEDEESIQLEAADFAAGGLTYGVHVEARTRDHDWSSWPRTSTAAVSPPIAEPVHLDLRITATPDAGAPRRTLSIVIIDKKGKPGPLGV
jgi:hypothetical protein